jgi:ribonuclease VapC
MSVVCRDRRNRHRQLGALRHHAAGLNLGDCCAYALSRYSGYPLLCKGQDFSRTDVRTPRLLPE